jgi:hypothetical protein
LRAVFHAAALLLVVAVTAPPASGALPSGFKDSVVIRWLDPALSITIEHVRSPRSLGRRVGHN